MNVPVGDEGARSALRGYVSAVKIHEGSETVVYRARSSATGAPVILKMTKTDYPTARELARLRRELAILRELDLPQIPKAYALEEHGRGLSLVMADIGLATLRDVLDDKPLSVEAAVRVALSIAGVLAEVHRRRVIHKDVTPKNILVDPATLEAHLIDFGISARLAEETQGGAWSALEGTLVYIAPEQTGRMNRAVDLRADLYSLGVILYEMLTGAVPFKAEASADLIHAHLARRATPPHERVPSVPEPLSDVVMTLLAKTPEDRYQSADGLKADLLECLEQWTTKKAIAPFPLRRRDKATELRRTQKLYGRERDVEALREAFERTRVRGPELCLVSGYAGVGKSALVHEVHKLTASVGGQFVSGKFDPVAQGAPLGPVLRAFRELILQILAEPPARLGRWKAALAEALGENGRIIIDLIPELELVIGPQPEPPALSPDQAKNRFEWTLQNFVNVFAAPDRPLVIFLDDLQWIDAASRAFLKLVLVDAYSENVLVIGSYRDNEVEDGHPLLLTLSELQRAGVRTTSIELHPLDQATVRRLVADTLTSSPEDVRALADRVYKKTQGNPFFTHQFLARLHEDGLLRFDAAAGAWRWDVAEIERANVTENVADLMVSKLSRLSPAARQAVLLASCVGFQFDLRSLATIGEASIADAATALWEAVREGLIIPLDNDYRLFEGSVSVSGADCAGGVELEEGFTIRYRFLHDRVLQAAYSLVEPDRKQELHLSIGRLLRRSSGASPREDEILEIVRHLSQGAKGITEDAERVDLARLCLRACRKAKGAAAYSAAASYAQGGMDLLREADWASDFEVCFALHMEAAECEHLGGNADRAKALFEAALPRARTDAERASLCKMRVVVLCSIGRYAEAVAVGCEGLTVLGIPTTPEELGSREVLLAELEQIQKQIQNDLGGRRIEDLVDTPELHDPRLRGALEILDAMAASAFYTGPTPYAVVGFKGMNLALRHGHTSVCAFNYMNGAFALTLNLGRVTEGLAFGELALALLERFPNAMAFAKVNVCFACCVPLRGSLREAIPYFDVATQMGIEVGDFAFLGAGCLLTIVVKVAAGDQLEDVLEVADRYLALIRRTKEPFQIALMTFARQTVAALLGRTRGKTSLSDANFDEEALLLRSQGEAHGFVLFHYYYWKLQLHLLYGESAEAFAALEQAEAWLAYAGGNPASKLYVFYACVALLGMPAAEAPEEAARRAEVLQRCRAQLEAQARWSPRAFKHMNVLIDAESARAAGEVERAGRLYEEAIELSRAINAPNIEAMACDLGAKFYKSIGAPRAARAFLRDAYRSYVHWGAAPRADAIAAEHARSDASRPRESMRPGGARPSSEARPSDLTNTGSTILSQTTLGSLREAALVVRAVQTIASEIDLPKVIEKLAAIVLENAGAERGALILSRGEQLTIEATFGVGGSAVTVGPSRPVERAFDLARGVVFYVARTREPVVLDDVATATRFADDPYMKDAAPKSILCLPLLFQGRLIGVLYLENTAAPGIFTETRVELIGLLSSQAAISIENARLLADVRASTLELTRANERLESELSRREEAERERAALQEQIIDGQRARLAELSTPLIPITKDIVVMPLIGTVDRGRAAQMMTVALEGAQKQRARVVILDITGLKSIDADVAGSLAGIAGALRLLGTETIVTGIAPFVARALVELDIDLTAFVTMGTLESGMEHALRRVRGGAGTLA
jgi:predicted ATPase/GAF domain-containing protein/tRNA A-37 threonylcarbamoyl transferase component Bud32